MTSSSASATMQPYTDALERALGQVVARAAGQLDLLKAQADAAVAAANARVSEAENKLLAIDAKVSQRLADLKDGEPGRDGKDADMLAVAGMVEEHVSRAVAELPPPERGEPGQDADIDSVKRIVAEAVEGAVAKLPHPKDGADGRDGHDVSEIEVFQTGPVVEFGFTVGEARSTFEIELPAGPQGETGERGPVGRLGQACAWSQEVHYEGQVRTHGGSTYQALKDTGREPPHEDWLLIAAAGKDGRDGAGLNPRRLWAPADEYKRLDVVALNGGSFVALKDDPGICPGDGWVLLTSQGKRGERGDRGEPGKKGDRGEPGRDAEPVIALAIDNQGMLTLTNGDGSKVQCDLYPVLAKINGS